MFSYLICTLNRTIIKSTHYEARFKSGFKVYMEDKCMPILPKSYSFKHLIPLAAFSYLSESYQHRIHITHCIARDKVGMFGYSTLLIDQRKT